jgi:DNA-binding CsgD family transcriptional regulator
MSKHQLTPVLEQYAEYVAKDMSNQEIANKLFRSEHTVRNNIVKIMQILNVKSRVGIAVKYIQSLDNPKQFTLSILFAMILSFNWMANPDADLRRVRRGRRTEQTA